MKKELAEEINQIIKHVNMLHFDLSELRMEDHNVRLGDIIIPKFVEFHIKFVKDKTTTKQDVEKVLELCDRIQKRIEEMVFLFNTLRRITKTAKFMTDIEEVA